MRFLLHLSFFNSILRLDPESPATPFRLLLPIFVLVRFVQSGRFRRRVILLLGLYAFFQLLSGLFSDVGRSAGAFPIHFNYIAMFLLFLLLAEERRPERFYNTLFWNYVLLLAVLVLQRMVGFTLPNTDDAGGALNGWYWNENDSSMAIAAFVLTSIRYRHGGPIWILHAIGIWIIWVNGSRACLGAIALYPLFVMGFGGRGLSGILRKGASGLGVLAVVWVFLIPAELMPPALAQAKETLTQLISLTEYENPLGSVQWRMQVMIVSLRTFLDGLALGVGAAGSYTLISNETYLGDHIQSLHNIAVQMLVELGLPLMLVLLVGAWRISRLPLGSFAGTVAIFSILSLSQSGGILTNYFAMVAMYLFLLVHPARSAVPPIGLPARLVLRRPDAPPVRAPAAAPRSRASA